MSYRRQRPRKGGDVDLTAKLKGLVEEYGLDPVETLFEFLDSQDDDYRLAAAKELMSYMYPKMKAVEVTGKSEHTVRIVDLTGEIDDDD